MHPNAEELKLIAHNYLVSNGFIVVDDEYGGYQGENDKESPIIFFGNYSKTGQQANNPALLVWVSDCDIVNEQESIEIYDKKQLNAILETICFLIGYVS